MPYPPSKPHIRWTPPFSTFTTPAGMDLLTWNMVQYQIKAWIKARGVNHDCVFAGDNKP